MQFFYVDEAGCLGVLPTATSPVQPIFTVAGIMLDQAALGRFTIDFLNLKEHFFPGLSPSSGEFLDWIKVEIKGADLRKQIRSGNRDSRRQAIGVLDKFLSLLEKYEVKIVGRVFVKGIGSPLDGTALYTASIQGMASTFQKYLEQKNDVGLMILDSRNKLLNSAVSHSVYTQKFKYSGDAYGRILDMPIFGHSDNHAGIQASDLVCSGFLFPMAAYVYCLGYVNNGHADYNYHLIRDRFGLRLKALQFRYMDSTGWWCGGIGTSDAINHQSSSLMFAPHKA